MNAITDDTVPGEPFSLFLQWLEEARNTEINDPEAMCLATCDRQGHPSARMVLLKQADERGFKFHTNAESQKGIEIAENNFAALCFHWKSLRKQVRVEGRVEIVSEEEADVYFKDRPRARQIGAWASQQSRPLKSRAWLEEKIEKLTTEYDGEEIPRPAYWKGYRLIPSQIEFWLDNPDRLHDRFLYTKSDKGWTIQRLYP